jgi:hypothetical protein
MRSERSRAAYLSTTGPSVPSQPDEVTRILGALGGVIPLGEVYSAPAIEAFVAVSDYTSADRRGSALM